MSVVSFVSEKGGVGKTTACYHIAVALRRYHQKRVLIVDADYQRGGISCRLIPSLIEDFGRGVLPGITVYKKFRDLYAGIPFTSNIDISETTQGIDLIPADPRLSTVSVDKIPSTNNLRDNNHKLWEHLSLIGRVLEPLKDDYDYILIDSHPEVSDVLRCVIYASQYVVSPVKLDLQSTIGVPTTIQVINGVNADVEMVERAIGGVGARNATTFSGAIGMMAREWGEDLKQSERTQYQRLQLTGGIFENWVTEGDGIRQAAEMRTDVYSIGIANAEKQSQQFRAVTNEFLNKCPP